MFLQVEKVSSNAAEEESEQEKEEEKEEEQRMEESEEEKEEEQREMEEKKKSTSGPSAPTKKAKKSKSLPAPSAPSSSKKPKKSLSAASGEEEEESDEDKEAMKKGLSAIVAEILEGKEDDCEEAISEDEDAPTIIQETSSLYKVLAPIFGGCSKASKMRKLSFPPSIETYMDEYRFVLVPEGTSKIRQNAISKASRAKAFVKYMMIGWKDITCWTWEFIANVQLIKVYPSFLRKFGLAPSTLHRPCTGLHRIYDRHSPPPLPGPQREAAANTQGAEEGVEAGGADGN
uniref:histone H3.v1-like isoform X2 n=1 Tax=Epinephelus lanceolatus TaxID=310571 RepID=UPI0014478702|nr:histone H3.v1-like isoform X2 [Epinephelus lanceolatus]